MAALATEPTAHSAEVEAQTLSTATSPVVSAVASSKAGFPTTVRGKLDKAQMLREEGGAYYAAKKYKRAIRKYSRIPAWISPFAKKSGGNDADAYAKMMGKSAGDNTTEDEASEAQKLMRIAYQNTAMCYVKLKDGAKTLESCRKAISYEDGEMWKVYRTKAHGHMLMRDLDAARLALEKARLLLSKDASLAGKEDKMTKKLEAQLQKMFNQHERRERKKYAGMFDR